MLKSVYSKVIHNLEAGVNTMNKKAFLDAMSLIMEKYLQSKVYVLLHFKTI